MTVQLQTLSCPDCGAVLKKRTAECEYCGAGFFFSEETGEQGHGLPSLLPLALSFSASRSSYNDDGNFISAGSTVSMMIKPAKRVVIDRLAIASSCVRDSFVVNDLRCGIEPLLDGRGSFSAEAFHPAYDIHPRLRPMLCDVGMDVSLSVTNITGAARRFNAELYCRVVPWTVSLRDGVLTTEEPKGESKS